MVLLTDYSSSEDLSSFTSWVHRRHSICSGRQLSSPYSLGVGSNQAIWDGCGGREVSDGSESSGVNDEIDQRFGKEASCRVMPEHEEPNGWQCHLLGNAKNRWAVDGKYEDRSIVWDISLKWIWNTSVEIRNQINYLEDSYALTTTWDEDVKLELSCHALNGYKLISSNF